VFVEYLETRDFRNLEATALEFTEAPVFLVGDNGHGKTNLLEAVVLCTTGRSFRHAHPYELIRQYATTAHLRARFSRQGVRHDIEVRLEGRERHVRVDSRAMRHVTQLLDLVNVVSFFPDDLRVVKGSPEERRRFLDRAIANHRPDFVKAAMAYTKAVRSRNALLRGRVNPDRHLLHAYDEQLVNHGSVISRCRYETLCELGPLAAARFAEIMAGVGSLELELDPGFVSAGDYGTDLRTALERSLTQDRARGMTSVGPHRADLRLRLAGREAREFASQGQQRAIVLGLKLAELEYLQNRLGASPLLVLDDVSSELDKQRTHEFFTVAARFATQMWVSSTGAAELPLPAKTQRFLVRQGCLTRVTSGF
jgi:DNA replication and repair protein RecF